ncbi:site-specific integrase [Staphylococcus gallinarum]|uniref:tyrosine-type recombinase/integrase n=1 Tax=Staphylococcus gallinarum TaxID=1293 RepID=UPI0030C38357
MNNVVKIASNIEEKLGVDIINEFSLESGINSERTVKAYREDTKQFIHYIFNGNQTIVASVLSDSLNRNNIIKFRTYLLEDKKLTASTVKRKLASIQELIKYMYSLGYMVNINLIKSLSKIKTVKNSYEVLTLEEANLIINSIKYNEKRNSSSKYFYCLLAFDTGIRAEALNKLTPSSFIEKEEEVLIKGIDKGKKSYIKSISKEFYESMKKELKIEDMQLDQNLFSFSEKNRHDMVKRAKESLGWGNRNITFHSFKKGAVTYAYESTKDIQIARKVGSHTSLSTTQTYLADSEEIFKGAVSNNYSIKNKNIKFEDYSKDDIVKVLKNMPEAAQLQIKTLLSDLK